MSKKILFLFCLLGQFAYTQSTITIRGTIQSATDQSPVYYANLQIGDFGTSADGMGQYKLTISKKVLNDTVSISAIGFKTQKMLARELIKIPNQELEEAIFDLQEVVVTPLVAYPLLMASIKENKANYNTKWVSGNYAFKQYNWEEVTTRPNEKQFLSACELAGDFNFKGTGRNNRTLNLSINESACTSDFIPFDTIASTNMHNIFYSYEMISAGKGRRGGSVFELDKNFGLSYRKVIDFDTIDEKRYYLIQTKRVQEPEPIVINPQPENELATESNSSSLNLSIQNRVNQAIQKQANTGRFSMGIDLLGYIWISTDDFGIKKKVYKHEYYNGEGQAYLKIHRFISYEQVNGIYLPKKLEIVKRKARTDGKTTYHYSVFKFDNFHIEKEFEKLPSEQVINPDDNLVDINFISELDKEHEYENWKELMKLNFLKPLRGDLQNPVFDYLEK
ncbi:MAG: hypothetical protein AAFO07_31725 [Bacteroidota bacterium]